MVTAIVLINAQRDKVRDAAEALSAIKGVAEVYSVGGRFDLAAIIRVKTNEDLAELVTGQLLKVEGILSTETLIAFQVYSRHDLETMFSVGMED